LIFLFTGVLLQNSHLAVIAEPIHQVSPVYPSQALELGLVGEVELTFSVETDGSVSDIEVAKYMGSSLFVPQAVSSFSLWIYKKPIAKIRNQRIIIAFELAR
jgi:TonB family protein